MHTNSKLLRRILFSCKCLVVTSALVFGCTSTSEDSGEVVLGAPTLNIDSPKSGDCANLVKTEQGEWLRASYTTTNWSLRPKGFCSAYGISQCGFAVAFVDGTRLVDIASLVIEIPRTSFSTSSSHTLRVELHTDTDLIALDANQNPLVSEVTFTLPPAGGLTCSGSDAGNSDSSDTDAADTSVEAETSADAESDVKTDSHEDADASSDVTTDTNSEDVTTDPDSAPDAGLDATDAGTDSYPDATGTDADLTDASVQG